MSEPICMECLQPFHLWSDGLHHWDRSLDFDHEPTFEMNSIVKDRRR